MTFFTKNNSAVDSPSSSAEDIEQQQVSAASKSDNEPYIREVPTTLGRAAFLDTFTPEEQKKIIRKVDYRILRIVGVIYLVKQIDVNNASSVKVLAVGKPTNILAQLQRTSDQYNSVQSIYYISYIIFELPSNLLLKWMKPRLFQTRVCFIWGFVLACHATVKDKEGLYACTILSRVG